MHAWFCAQGNETDSFGSDMIGDYANIQNVKLQKFYLSNLCLSIRKHFCKKCLPFLHILHLIIENCSLLQTDSCNICAQRIWITMLCFCHVDNTCTFESAWRFLFQMQFLYCKICWLLCKSVFYCLHQGFWKPRPLFILSFQMYNLGLVECLNFITSVTFIALTYESRLISSLGWYDTVQCEAEEVVLYLTVHVRSGSNANSVVHMFACLS